MATRIVTSLLISRSCAILFSRVLGLAGTPITQATISSITAETLDLEYGRAVVWGPNALTVASVVYNSLIQNDQAWYEAGGDSLGYNFKYTFPAAALAIAGKRIRFDVKFIAATADQFIVQAEGNMRPTWIA